MKRGVIHAVTVTSLGRDEIDGTRYPGAEGSMSGRG